MDQYSLVSTRVYLSIASVTLSDASSYGLLTDTEKQAIKTVKMAEQRISMIINNDNECDLLHSVIHKLIDSGELSRESEAMVKNAIGFDKEED